MWYAIVEKGTGIVYSTGTVIAKEIPDKYEVVELGDDYDQNNQVYDYKTKQIVAIKDTVAEAFVSKLLQAPELNDLTDKEKQGFAEKLRKLFATGEV